MNQKVPPRHWCSEMNIWIKNCLYICCHWYLLSIHSYSSTWSLFLERINQTYSYCIYNSNPEWNVFSIRSPKSSHLKCKENTKIFLKEKIQSFHHTVCNIPLFSKNSNILLLYFYFIFALELNLFCSEQHRWIFHSIRVF